MSTYSFTLQPNTSNGIWIPVYTDLTGYTVAAEISDTRDFSAIFTTIPVNQIFGNLETVTFTIDASAIDTWRDRHYRIKATKDGLTKYLTSGIAYVQGVVDLPPTQGGGGGASTEIARTTINLPAMALDEKLVVTIEWGKDIGDRYGVNMTVPRNVTATVNDISATFARVEFTTAFPHTGYNNISVWATEGTRLEPTPGQKEPDAFSMDVPVTEFGNLKFNRVTHYASWDLDVAATSPLEFIVDWPAEIVSTGGGAYPVKVTIDGETDTVSVLNEWVSLAGWVIQARCVQYGISSARFEVRLDPASGTDYVIKMNDPVVFTSSEIIP